MHRQLDILFLMTLYMYTYRAKTSRDDPLTRANQSTKICHFPVKQVFIYWYTELTTPKCMAWKSKDYLLPN